MRYVVILCMVALTACTKPTPVEDSASVATVWMTNLEEALMDAKGQGRDILVKFETQWCPYCKFVEERVFNKEEVAAELSKFILLSLDGDDPKNQSLMERFNIRGFPTFLVLDKKGVEEARFNDVGSAAEFLELLDKRFSDVQRLFNLADAMLEDENFKGAKKTYEKAYGVLLENQSASTFLLEKALCGILKSSKGDTKEGIRLINRLLTEFPESVFRPEYYKRLADLYSSDVIRKNFLNKAAGIIKNSFKKIGVKAGFDERRTRIILDQQVDLFADIYKDLGLYNEIHWLYLTAAKLCEKQIEKGGGLKVSTHLIGQTVSYYLKGGDLKGAEKFISRAVSEIPDYWPVYSSYAKIKLKEGKLADAVSLAKKAYHMADAVAKPRVALLWAEAYAAKKDYKEAVNILKLAEDDLAKTGAESFGRASAMLKKLQRQAGEYGDIK